MAESTCLHIQDRDAGPIRIVEIPWISVRIGRAAFCEVRLTDPALPEEACRLHRRGRTWHLTPLGGSGVALDGRPIAAAQPLPFDVPFQIGGFSLALKHNKFADADWRPSNDSRSRSRTRAATPPPPPTAAAPPTPTPEPAPRANPWEARWRAAGDRLKAARAADLHPEPPAAAPPPPPPAPQAEPRPPRDRKPAPEAPRPTLRKAEPPPRPRPRTTAPPPPSTPASRPETPRFDPTAYRLAPRPAPSPAPPRAEPHAPRAWAAPAPAASVPITAPVVPPAPAPVVPPPPAPVVPPAPVPSASAADFLDPDHVARLERLDVESLARDAAEAIVVEPTAPATAEPVAPPVAAPTPVPIAEPVVEVEVEAPEILVEPEPEPKPVLALEYQPPLPEPAPEPTVVAAPEQPTVVEAEVEIEVEAELEVEADVEPEPLATLIAEPVVDVEPEPTPIVVPIEAVSVETVETPPRGAVEEPTPGGFWPSAPTDLEASPDSAWRTQEFVADTCGFGGEFGFASRYESESSAPLHHEVGPTARDPRPLAPADPDESERFDPTRSRRTRTDEAACVLPSVQDVLNAGLNRGVQDGRSRPIPRPSLRPAWKPIEPTKSRPPAQWNPPAWLTTPPALLLTLTVGGLLAYCSLRQAQTSHDASLVLQTSSAFREGGRDRPLPNAVVPPRASWWSAAPAHLAAWGVYLDGTRVEHGLNTTAVDWFESAAVVGPLEAQARLNLARRVSPAPGGAEPPLSLSLGLSRDAVSLGYTAQTLRKAGKNAEAVKAYRLALEIASRTASTPLPQGPLTYNNDPSAPRYLLPGEALAATIAADLVADSSWRYSEWAEAVPETGVSALAVARAMKRQGRSDAEAILKRIVDQAAEAAKDRAGGLDDAVAELDADAEALALAVEAEAFALRADWNGAERRYQAAIDRMTDPRIRRSWWFNLADVAMRLNDVEQRRAALDEVLAAVDVDDVSRRAMELQRGPSTSGTNRLGSTGPR